MNQYQSENLNEIFTALSKAQAEMKGAVKDSNNPFFKSKYADINSVLNAIREPLSNHQLSVHQYMYCKDEHDFIVTMLGHSSGQWLKSEMRIFFDKTENGRINVLQKLGSSISYLRRYALSAILCCGSEEDDDANSAVSNYVEEKKKETLISQGEINNLNSIYSLCDKERQNMFVTYCKSMNIESMKSIPKSKYDSILKTLQSAFDVSKKIEINKENLELITVEKC